MAIEQGEQNNNHGKRSSFQNVKYQYLAVIIANIITLCHGCAIGWLSPALPYLQSPESPLVSGPLNLSQTSWIGSYFSIGAVLGNCVFGIISNYIGRKNTTCILCIPNLAFWTIVMFARNVEYLYIARILAGFTGGGIYVCIPLFVAEIADQSIRGRLGSLLMLNCTAGILFSFVAGSYLSYMDVPKVFMAIPVLFLFAFVFLPETPQHHIARNDYDCAKQSLKYYKNCTCADVNACDELNRQFDDLVKNIEKNAKQPNDPASWRDLFAGESIKALLICFSMTGINLFSGTFAMMNYTASIFKASGSDLDPHTSAIIVAVIQILGVYCSTNLVDRVGRKPLLLFSTTGAFFGLMSLGTFSYLSSSGLDLSNVNWIPLASFSTFVFISCFGILPLPFIITAEVLPQNIRGIGSTLCMLSNSLFAFISVKCYPLLMDSVHLYGVSWICAGFCLYGILFTIFILKETKGKNLNAVGH